MFGYCPSDNQTTRPELDYLLYLQGFTDLTLMPGHTAAVICNTKKGISCEITQHELSQRKQKGLLIANDSAPVEVIPYFIVPHFLYTSKNG